MSECRPLERGGSHQTTRAKSEECDSGQNFQAKRMQVLGGKRGACFLGGHTCLGVKSAQNKAELRDGSEQVLVPSARHLDPAAPEAILGSHNRKLSRCLFF